MRPLPLRPLSFSPLLSLSLAVSPLSVHQGHGKGQEPFQTLSVWRFSFSLSAAFALLCVVSADFGWS